MIQIRPHPPQEAAEWEGLVRRCGGNALHLPPVHETQCEASRIERLVFERSGEVLACALAWPAESRRLKGLLGRSRQLLLPTAPAVVTEDAAADVRGALFEHARGQGFDRLVIQPLYSQWIVGDEDLAAYRTTAVTEFVLDLSEGEEAVRASMHKNHRKNARRAARDGVVIAEDGSLEGLLRLRELQLSSAERAEEKTEGFGVPDEEFFHLLHDKVYSRDLGSVLFAEVEGRPVAALAWIEGAARAQTVRSGSLPEGYRNRAMYLLYAELIHRIIERGVVELNAGGVPSDAAEKEHPQSGLYEFKQGFGGTAAQRYGLDIPLAEVDR